MNFSTQFMRTLEVAREEQLNSLNSVATLFYLSECDDGASPSDIAKVVKTSAANMTGINDRLERMGLIERDTNDQVDRRTRRVSITEKGLEAIARMMPTQTCEP